MATYKSELATNATAQPVVKTNPEKTGQAYNAGETFSLTTDHDAADVILMFPVPTNTTVRALLFSTDGASTTGAADFGLYTLGNDGTTLTAVDVDLFASAQAVTSALTRSDITGEAGTITINERFVPLWEAAGAASDPTGVYWVALTVTTDVDDTTVIGLEIEGVF